MSQPLMDPPWLFVCFFLCSWGFLQLLTKIPPKKTPMDPMSGWPMSTQSHLMDIIQMFICLADFLMVWADFHTWFGHPPRKLLETMEEIQHSQDLKIESANKFQHGLWSLFSNQHPPIHALCSKFFFPKNMSTAPLYKECSIYLKWIQRHFQRDSCAKESFEYLFWMIMVFLKERVGGSMCKASLIWLWTNWLKHMQ